MPYVYSTATSSGSYVKYAPSNGPDNNKGHHKILKKVTINGGANVATKHLVTPKGVSTYVTDEDLEFLLSSSSFKRHMAAGFITYDKRKVEPDKKAKDMKDKDASAPLTLKDFEKGENGDENTKVYKGIPKSKQ